MRSCSLARLNDVALEVTKIGIIGRAPALASAGRVAFVALSELLGVLVIWIAATPQVECSLDTSSADLHSRRLGIFDKVLRQFTAVAQCTLSNIATQDVLVHCRELPEYLVKDAQAPRVEAGGWG